MLSDESPIFVLFFVTYVRSCCVILIRAPFCWKDMNLYTKLSHVSTRIFFSTWRMNNRQNDPHIHRPFPHTWSFVYIEHQVLFVCSFRRSLLVLFLSCVVLSCGVLTFFDASKIMMHDARGSKHNTICLFVCADR